MAYREDLDLNFLKNCENDDLDILVKYLISDKDGNKRLTEELTTHERFKKDNPNHKVYWDLIAAEVQCYGANTFATILRGGQGVLYKEILIEVCEKMKVNTSLAKSASIGYRLKIKMATDGVCLRFKINSWFALIHEK